MSICVIGVLIGLMLPTISHIRESTRRVICQSNLRQVGLGVAQYADEFDDFLAPSRFYNPDQPPPDTGHDLAQMMTLRVPPESEKQSAQWDGLGLLYSSYQLRAPEIFYCPSHYGDHAYQEYADAWRVSEPEIMGNYHYRGVGPNNARRLRSVEPVRAALVTDGMRTAMDINHRVGMNVLRADFSVSWYFDSGRQIVGLLTTSPNTAEPNPNSVLSSVWRVIDRPPGTLSSSGGGGGPGR